MMEISSRENEIAKIMVIGIGGCGNNAVSSMISDRVNGVTYVCINTDKQDLKKCTTAYNMPIGAKLTKGLGAGSNPAVGEQAALENENDIEELIKDQNMVILTCGMGGGTGTGATPVIAGIARKLGILTVGVVTKPFTFEAKQRMNHALEGIEKLKQNADTVIVISNNMLLKIVDKHTSLPEALKESDKILKQTIQGITELINEPALINLDFADITTIMKHKGIAYIGIGVGQGQECALQAVENALKSPLLETNIKGATHVLLYLSGDISLLDAQDGASEVQSMVSENAIIIFGAKYDEFSPEQVVATIIATGLEDTKQPVPLKKPSETNNGFDIPAFLRKKQ